ncbi:hypothetical protein [Metapseudomonas otitidis]|uniref:hypothetical protein n=1 Tax=Metapseudomonas otitidis TaxID=319939 RepID=UPI002603D5D6|nr:hypothetical protein [Pseudomonas otitidis]
MPPLVRRAWRLIRDAKASHYTLLLFGPMFIQPLAFLKQPGQPKPLYARLRGLWGTPLIVAGTFALTTQSLHQWLLWLQSTKASALQPTTDLIRQLHDTQHWFSWGSFALAALLIYTLASLRWGYHYGIITLVGRWRSDLAKPPLLYFVVNTAAFGMWLSLFYSAFARAMWQWDGQGNFGEELSEYAHANQSSILIILLTIGALQMAASRNSRMGRKALYGGSWWICLVIDLISIAMWILLVLFVSRS